MKIVCCGSCSCNLTHILKTLAILEFKIISVSFGLGGNKLWLHSARKHFLLLSLKDCLQCLTINCWHHTDGKVTNGMCEERLEWIFDVCFHFINSSLCSRKFVICYVFFFKGSFVLSDVETLPWSFERWGVRKRNQLEICSCLPLCLTFLHW